MCASHALRPGAPGATHDLIGRPYDPSLVTVEPMPPSAPSSLAWAGAGRSLLRDPTGYLQELRARLGDTFVLDAFGYRLLFVFSPAGVHALYGFDERDASFMLATFSLLRLKLPDRLFLERRSSPHALFGSQDAERYLDNLRAALELELDELGSGGTFEVFTEAKRIAHRLGFASWVCQEATEAERLERLLGPFEELDAAESFVRPAVAFRTLRTGHRREWQALATIEEVIAEIWAERRRHGVRRDDMLERAVAAFAADHDPDDAVRQAARDLVVIHLGSQSNLYAGLAWTIVDVLRHPEILAAVRAGDDRLLERCASESIRMAQRSLTLRYVTRPVDLPLEDQTYRVGRGAFLATMLSVTNATADPALSRYDPAHFEGRRLTVPLPAKELVSTFGHGPHTCPAARFSILAIRLTVRRLLARYELTPLYDEAEPKRRQLGGVARSERPCVLRYAARPH